MVYKDEIMKQNFLTRNQFLMFIGLTRLVSFLTGTVYLLDIFFILRKIRKYLKRFSEATSIRFGTRESGNPD